LRFGGRDGQNLWARVWQNLSPLGIGLAAGWEPWGQGFTVKWNQWDTNCLFEEEADLHTLNKKW